MASSHGKAPHALVVPASLQGHINGAMLLSHSLVALGFEVSFVYFSSYYARLHERKRFVLPNSEETGDSSSQSDAATSSQSTGSADAIDAKAASDGGAQQQGGFDAIRVCVVEDGLETGHIEKLTLVTPAMKENLLKLIVEGREQGRTMTCLISDTFLPWTVDVAHRAGIPRVEFWTSNAMSYLFVINIGRLYAEGIFPEKGSPTQWKAETPLMLSHIPGLPPFSSEIMPQDLRFADVSNEYVQFFLQFESCAKSAERVLIHSLLELEPSAFKAFEIQGIPVYAIGPLPSRKHKLANEQAECISWLNSRSDSSVIYVAFGSSARLSVEEIQELAMGLEGSGHSFLWVIREDAYKREELPQVLPGGFHGRTSGKGLIISWAPQVEVLAHKAVGGFLSHCGWNSTLESLWAGVPVLCCPRFAEQRLNSHYLCDVWGAGVELMRTDTGGLERSSVELGVKALLDGEEGLKARIKAREIMHLARKTCQKGGQSFANLQEFYNDMREHCSKPQGA